jgi:hypothetical protein
MIPMCPICLQPTRSLQSTHDTTAPFLYMCHTKEVELYGRIFRYVDSSIVLNEHNERILRVYEIPPYKITIRSSANWHDTLVEKMVLDRRPTSVHNFTGVHIFSINSLIEFPLHDPKRTIEKIEKLLVFS